MTPSLIPSTTPSYSLTPSLTPTQTPSRTPTQTPSLTPTHTLSPVPVVEIEALTSVVVKLEDVKPGKRNIDFFNSTLSHMMFYSSSEQTFINN